MAIEEIKQKLHELIDASMNGVLLEDLLVQAQSESLVSAPHEKEGLSKEDYEELELLAKEHAEKETISYDELKASLSRWFTN